MQGRIRDVVWRHLKSDVLRRGHCAPLTKVLSAIVSAAVLGPIKEQRQLDLELAGV